MSDSTPSHRPVFDAPPDDVVRYRAVSGLALGGLLAGLASAVALVGPLGWGVSAGGVALNALALARIARAGRGLIGRVAPLAGLVLSAFFAAAGVSRWWVGNRLLDHEARRFAAVWFDALRRGDFYKAQQLTLDPHVRWPPGEDPRDFYRGNPRRREQLQRYVLQPPVRALLALGSKAEVRFYETADQGQQDGRPWVQLTYAVSYDDPGDGRTSFFLGLLMDRLTAAGRTDWRVLRVDGGVRPQGW